MSHINSVPVVTPAVAFQSEEYLLALGELPNATSEQIEAACAACDRLEARHKEVLEAEHRLNEDMLAAEATKAERALKVDAAIKKVEADIIERFRAGLVRSGGDRVFEDAHEAKELAMRFEASVANGNLGAAMAALRSLRQGSIGAGVLYHFGSGRKQDEFLLWAEEELKRLQIEKPHKKRGKSRK